MGEKTYSMGGSFTMGRPKAQPDTAAECLRVGAAHHRAGRLGEAESLYRKALELEPASPDALHMLGVLALQANRPAVAADIIRKAILIKGDDGDYHLNLGIALGGLGKPDEALSCFETAARLAPGNPQAHYNLGLALAQTGRFGESVDRFRRVLKKDPKNPMVHMNLGLSLMQAGDRDKCLMHLRRAVDLAPGHLLPLTNYAQALFEMDDAAAAQPLFETALRAAPDHLPALLGLARCRMGKTGDGAQDDWIHGIWAAKDLVTKAVRLAPRDFDAITEYGRVMEQLGLFSEAEQAFRAARDLAPGDERGPLNLGTFFLRQGRIPEALEVLEATARDHGWTDKNRIKVAMALSNSGRFDKARDIAAALSSDDRHRMLRLAFTLMDKKAEVHEAELAFAESRLDDDSLPANERATLFCTLADYYDKRKVSGKAFDLIMRGHALRRQAEPYDPAAEVAFVERCEAYFTAERLRTASPDAVLDDQRPVFIVGMPRSGTTLVEQIIASHPRCHGAGEMVDMAIFRATTRALSGFANPFPDCLDDLDPAVIRGFGERYLTHASQGRPDAARITDKMPHNFLNLGLIARVFPKARVIHCRRDPMDTCLSILFQNFASAHGYANDLHTLGQAYNNYRRLMAHWRRVLPLPMLEVDYEEMVADQERRSRDLIDFLGLDWDDACLQFHKTDRAVQTASLWQVRQPIYTSSVERWRRYETELAPLKAILDTAEA